MLVYLGDQLHGWQPGQRILHRSSSAGGAAAAAGRVVPAAMHTAAAQPAAAGPAAAGQGGGRGRRHGRSAAEQAAAAGSAAGGSAGPRGLAAAAAPGSEPGWEHPQDVRRRGFRILNLFMTGGKERLRLRIERANVATLKVGGAIAGGNLLSALQ
jgi:hypothetical protein